MQGILNDAIGIQALLASVVILLDVVEAEVARQDEQKKCRHVACEIGGFGWACRDRRAALSLVVVQMEDKTRNKKTRRNGRHAKSILYDTVVRMEHAASTCSQI